MIRRLQMLVSMLLVGLLGLTGQALAVAQVAPMPAGQMVICTSQGPVMVFVDADGAPTDPPRYCPESAATLLVAAAETAPSPDWSPQEFALIHFGPVWIDGGRTLTSPKARGPPWWG